MLSKHFSCCQACWSKFLSYFNFKISYCPGSQCKADTLTQHSQDLLSDSNPCQDFMKQVVLKPKNLAHSEVQVKPIQILRHSEAALVDTEPDTAPLSDIIQAVYNNLAEGDPVATVSQMLRDFIYLFYLILTLVVALQPCRSSS